MYLFAADNFETLGVETPCSRERGLLEAEAALKMVVNALGRAV